MKPDAIYVGGSYININSIESLKFDKIDNNIIIHLTSGRVEHSECSLAQFEKYVKLVFGHWSF